MCSNAAFVGEETRIQPLGKRYVDHGHPDDIEKAKFAALLLLIMIAHMENCGVSLTESMRVVIS
jgi:hypothetical protein